MIEREKKTTGKEFSNIKEYLLGLRNQVEDSLSANWGYYTILNERVNVGDFILFFEKASDLGFTKKEYAEMLHINVRTLDRNLKEEFTLKIDKYENAMRIFDLMIHGIEVFGDELSFATWLREKNLALKDKPVHLLGSIAGIQIVDDAITRLEYGVYL
ncbi:MAG: DUF2384 domain-containing protein [Marinifilum sp.]|jgi:putative toxin-antitoxin system antitoxin component (TIGR02293 family)|nr:DUF2384 domain-containing protein [Marinifilum sp.]